MNRRMGWAGCIILLLLVSGVTIAAQVTILAGDPRIQKMGRMINLPDGSVEFAASGVSFFLQFTGRQISADIQDEFLYGSSYNYFSVVVDNELVRRFRTEPGKNRYILADSLLPGTHTLVLCKDTEGQNGRVILKSFTADQVGDYGSLPIRKIEFIGNSITCGMGMVANKVPCKTAQWFDQHHAWNAFGPLSARQLGAQWMLSSVSGIGVTRNWNSPGPVMPAVYYTVFMNLDPYARPWDFTGWAPDLYVIGLGTNDFSDGDQAVARPAPDSSVFVNSFRSFIYKLRKNNPAARILLTSSPVLQGKKLETLDRWLQVLASGDQTGNTRVFQWSRRYDRGCDGHPDSRDHRLMAAELTPEIRKWMNW